MANKSRQRPVIERAFPLIDLEISRGGDGRTVTAYAATFGDPYEVRDQHGHYFETINRAAFNRAVSHGIGQLQVLFNHGRTLEGTPSERFSLPLGTPIEVRPDSRGLLTVTRYAKTPLADDVLELIRNETIRAQSFRGPIFRSAPPISHANGLPLIERTELGLREYGPAPFPVNTGAAMVGVRSQLLTVDPEELTDEERLELLALLNGTETAPPASVPGDNAGDHADGDEEDTQQPPAAEPAPVAGPSLATLHEINVQRRRRLGIR